MLDNPSFIKDNKLGDRIKNITFLYQYSPTFIENIMDKKTISYAGKKLKTNYLLDFFHILISKYYFTKENKFTLNSIILKQKYGQDYNYYVNYLISIGSISVVKDYMKGVSSRVYKINDKILKNKIKRRKNYDKILIKKYKNNLLGYDFNDISNSDDNYKIDIEIRHKLIDDLYHFDIDLSQSIFFLDSLKDINIDIYNKNTYSVESIKLKKIYYVFDDYGRLHTNFTVLKSYIRKNCLTVGGEPTCELDISNSQPLFLYKLIKESDSKWVDKKELELYKILTKSGNFYQYIIDNSKEKNRDNIKKMIYRVFFGKNYLNSDADKIFNKLFPTIYKFIKLYKVEKGSHKKLSHRLQLMESDLLFNKIIKKIHIIYPDIKIITVHDSILFPLKYKNDVKAIFDYELKREFD